MPHANNEDLNSYRIRMRRSTKILVVVGWGVTSIVRMCVPTGPIFFFFFQQKVYDWPDISYWYMKGPKFLTSRYMHIVFGQRFFEAACSLGIQWLRYFSNYQQWMGTKKNQRAVYEWVNISDDLKYKWVRFFKRQVYEWRFRNTGLHIRITFIPKLPHERISIKTVRIAKNNMYELVFRTWRNIWI